MPRMSGRGSAIGALGELSTKRRAGSKEVVRPKSCLAPELLRPAAGQRDVSYPEGYETGPRRLQLAASLGDISGQGSFLGPARQNDKPNVARDPLPSTYGGGARGLKTRGGTL